MVVAFGKDLGKFNLVSGSYNLIRVLCLRDLYLGSTELYYDLGSLIYPKFSNVTHT